MRTTNRILSLLLVLCLLLTAMPAAALSDATGLATDTDLPTPPEGPALLSNEPAYTAVVDYEKETLTLTSNIGEIGITVTNSEGEPVSLTISNTPSTLNLSNFSRYFGDKPTVLSFESSYNDPASITIPARPAFDTTNYTITYTYNSATNTYTRVFTPLNGVQYDFSSANFVYSFDGQIRFLSSDEIKKDGDKIILEMPAGSDCNVWPVSNPGSNEAARLRSFDDIGVYFGDLSRLSLTVTDNALYGNANTHLLGETLTASVSGAPGSGYYEPTYKWYSEDGTLLVSGATYTPALGLSDVNLYFEATVGPDTFRSPTVTVSTPLSVDLNLLGGGITIANKAPVPYTCSVISDTTNETLLSSGLSAGATMSVNVLEDAGKSVSIQLTTQNGSLGTIVYNLPAKSEITEADTVEIQSQTANSVTFKVSDRVVEFVYQRKRVDDGSIQMKPFPTPVEIIDGTATMNYIDIGATCIISIRVQDEGLFPSDPTEVMTYTHGSALLSPASPLVGDTVTATVDVLGSDPLPDGYHWAWYVVSSDNTETPLRVTAADSDTRFVGPDMAGMKLKAQLFVVEGMTHLTLFSATTDPIPAPKLVLTKDDGTPLPSNAAGDTYYVNIGDTVTASIENLPKDTTYSYRWEGPNNDWFEQKLTFSGPIEQFRCDDYINLSVIAYRNSDPFFRAITFVQILTPAPTVTIDYEAETLVGTKHPNIRDGFVLTTGSAQSGTDLILPISTLDSGWPNDTTHDVSVQWYYPAADPPYKAKDTTTVTLPARPVLSGFGANLSATGNSIVVHVSDPSLYRFSLTAPTEATPGNVLDAFGGVFTGLAERTTYRVWVQQKAVAGKSFASEWVSFDVTTAARDALTVSPVTLTYDPTLTLSAVSPTLTDAAGNPVSLTPDTDYTLALTDDTRWPHAGDYTCQIRLTDAAQATHKFSGDDPATTTFALRVDPAALQVTVTAASKTYDGTTAVTCAATDFADQLLGADTTSITVTAHADSADAGTQPVRVTSLTSSNPDYTVTQRGTTSVTIAPRTVTIEGTAALPYTGSTALSLASVTTLTLGNTISGDTVSLDLSTATATVATPDAAPAPQTALLQGAVLTGPARGNYTLPTAPLCALLITKAAPPTIVWPTASTITYGDELRLSTLTSTDQNGTFAWQTETAKLPAGEQTSTVVYTPSDPDNYDYTGITLTQNIPVTVAKAAPPTIVWPTASTITYGDELRLSTLTSTDQNGTFAWATPDAKLRAGDHQQTVVYTPSDTANYDYTTLTHAIPVTVTKAATILDVTGVQTAYTYTGAPQSVTTGATLNHTEATPIYTNNTFTTVQEGNGLTVTISVPETANYLPANATVTLTVNKAKAPAIVWPTASTITYGDELRASTLTSADQNGTFAWATPDAKLPAGEQAPTVVYTPSDPDNYDYTTLTHAIPVTVNKAATILDVTGVQTAYTYTGAPQSVTTGATLNHTEATPIYTNNTFTTVQEGNGLTVTISVPETANYLPANATVTLTVAKAAPPIIQWPTASTITYGDPLRTSTLTSADPNGTFAWAIPDAKLPAGEQAPTVVYTPSDPDNYDWPEAGLSQEIPLQVTKRNATITIADAAKTYGDPDPAWSYTVDGLIPGDALTITVTRAPGESADTYTLDAEVAAQTNYEIHTIPGTLTIHPRSLSALTVDRIGAQIYTGRSVKPQPTVHDGDTELVPDRDYTLTYSGVVGPGKGEITITGRGNYTGEVTVSFYIVIPEQQHLKTALGVTGTGTTTSIVTDEQGLPMDYDLIDAPGAGTDPTDRLLLIRATPGTDDTRILSLTSTQLNALLTKRTVRLLAFENAGAVVLFDLRDLLSLDTPLTAAQLAKATYEVRIVPVTDPVAAVDISVWLRWPDGELELTPSLTTLQVALSLNGPADQTDLCRLTDDGTPEPLTSTLLTLPTDLLTADAAMDWYHVTLQPDGTLTVTERQSAPASSVPLDVLSTAPATGGRYLLQERPQPEE